MARKKIDLGPYLFSFPDEDLKTSLHDEIVLWLKRSARQIAMKLVNWNEAWPADFVEKEKARVVASAQMRKPLLQQAIESDTEQLRKIGEKALGLSGWSSAEIAKRLDLERTELAFLETWRGLEEPPPPEFEVVTKSERPIQRQRYQSTDIVGYLDMVFSIRGTWLHAGYLPTDELGKPKLGIDPKVYTTWHVEWRDLGRFAFDAKSSIPSFGELIRQFRTYEVYCNRLPFYAVSPDARFASDISDEGFGFIKYPEGEIIFPIRRQEDR